MGLLRWLGFVKLADYGLELTSEHRIRSRGWVVLDDGSSGAIVGWTANDTGVEQLNKWQLVKPQTAAPKNRDDEEWEWMIAAAHARGDAPRFDTPRVEPPRVDPPRVEPPRVVPPPRVERLRVVPPPRSERPRVEPLHAAQPPAEALIDEQPTHARIADELPTKTWLEGNTEIDPPRATVTHLRIARGTPSPEAIAPPTIRVDPWKHEPTVPAAVARMRRAK